MEVFIVFIIRLPNRSQPIYTCSSLNSTSFVTTAPSFKKCLRKIFEVFRMLCNCQILKNTVIFGSFYRIHYPVAQPFPTDLYVFIIKFYAFCYYCTFLLKKCLRKIFEVFRMLCNCQILKNTVIFGSFYRIHYPVAQPFPTDLYVFIVKFYRLLLLLHLPLKKCLRKIFEVFRMLM